DRDRRDAAEAECPHHVADGGRRTDRRSVRGRRRAPREDDGDAADGGAVQRRRRRGRSAGPAGGVPPAPPPPPPPPPPHPLAPPPGRIHGDISLAIVLSALIGSVSFAGSLIAFAKLQELIQGRPIVYPGQKLLNGALLAACVAAGIAIVAGAEQSWLLWVLV